jgi:hypothetical protein
MSRTNVDTVETLRTGHTLPRVNLLPPEVHQARKVRQLRVGLGAGVAVVALAVAGVYLLQVQNANNAKDELAKAQAQGLVLQGQKAQFVQVPQILGAIESAENARQTAMSQDVQWYRYLNDFSYVTPKRAWINTFEITLASASQVSTTPLAHSGVATVTVTGAAMQHNDVAAWLDSVAKERGWTDAYFTDSEKVKINDTVGVKWNSTATVTADALSHRYDRKAG